MSTALALIHASHWLAAVLLFGIAAYGARLRHRPAVTALAVFCALSGLWALCSALIPLAPDLETKVLLNRIKMIAPASLPPAILGLVMTVRQNWRWQRLVWGAFAVIPFATLLFLLSPTHHLLVIGSYGISQVAGRDILTFDNGPWFSVHNANARFIAFASILLLIQTMRDLTPTHRHRIWLIILAIVIPFAADSFAVFFVPWLRYVQSTPTFLLISALLMVYAIVGNHLVDVVPLAREKILDNLGDIFLVFNEKLELVDFNARAGAVLHLSRREIGSQTRHLASLDDNLEELLSLDLSRGKCEWSWSNSVYEVTRHLIEGENTTTLGTIIACKDITERKHEELALRELDDIKTKLLAIIGHDFRGNLTASLVIAQNLVDGLKSMQEKDVALALRNIEKTALQNIMLVEELLDWAKHQIGGSPPKDKVDLQDAAASAISFVEPLTRSRGVSIRVEIEGDCKVYVEGATLETIMRNLLTNAVKASSPLANVTIKMNATRNDLTLMVEDHGSGIPADQMKELFQLKKQKNVGIGLFLCREIVMRLGGRIWAESELGTGSRFYVNLPLALPD